MKILVLQHMTGEDAGLFAQIMEADGIGYDVIEVQTGAVLPSPDSYQGLLVLGGAQQVWETNKYVWLGGEIEFIRQWVRAQHKPYFGICLGHQLLAVALGGEVGVSDKPELGYPQVELTESASEHPLLMDFPKQCRWLQWHEAEVKTVPDGLRVMASSADCAVQILAADNHVLSLQFHAEAVPRQIERWTANADNAKSMRDLNGDDAVEKLLSESESYLANAELQADRLFQAWLTASRIC